MFQKIYSRIFCNFGAYFKSEWKKRCKTFDRIEIDAKIWVYNLNNIVMSKAKEKYKNQHNSNQAQKKI